MKDNQFTQLTLWSEEVLAELEVPSAHSDPVGIDQGDNNQKGEEVFIQLTLPGFDEADLD